MVTALLLMLGACKEDASPRQAERPVAVMTVGHPQGMSEVRYAGQIRSAFESQIGFQVAGRIIQRDVEQGDHVRAGQVLLRLDDGDYARALDSAVAQSKSARTAAATQRAELARSRELLAKGFISPAEFDQQQAATAQADAQLRAAGAQRGTASAQLGRTVLCAPRGGVVTQLQAEVGQVVGAGQTVLVLADSGEPEIAVDLPEGSLGAARSAERAWVSLWSDPGKRYPAHLRTLAGAADPATRTFPARFVIEAPAGVLMMGESAELHLAGPSGKGAIEVPVTAIVNGQDGKPRVWVLDGKAMTVLPRVVTLGTPRGESVAVLSGLRPGEQVVRAGAHLLHPGEKVRVAKVPAS